MTAYIVTTREDAPGAWHDNILGVEHEPGTSYETDKARAEQVMRILPEYVEISEKTAKKTTKSE